MASSSAPQAPQRPRPSGPEVLYTTLSMCPVCTLLDHRGLELHKSELIIRSNAVWLRVHCDVHNLQDTLVCSDIAWYKRVLASSVTPQALNDMEDLKKALTPTAQRLPLITEISLHENGDYITDDELKAKIASLQRLYEPVKKIFLLKLCGKLAPNLAILNQKILLAFGLLTRREPVLVDLSYERMQLLAGLPDSCFLHPRIFPSLKYYIRLGDEENAAEEIKTLLTTLKEFTGIQVVVALSIQRPWPNVMPLLNMLRKDFVGLVKLIELTMERAPSAMVESVRNVDERRKAEIREFQNATPKKVKKEKKPEKEYHPLMADTDSESDDDDEPELPRLPDFGPMEYSALDPFELIAHLRDSSLGDIDEEDFHPMSMASVLEPFLELVGLGRFSIRPSSSCGFGACFFSTNEISSASVSKYLDFTKFSQLMKPLLPSIREKGIGFFSGRSIKKAIKGASKQKLPDIVGIMADTSKASVVNDFVDKLQFLVIHNNMDVASIDMSRRCDCSVLSLENNRLVSSCTGCF